MITTQFLQNCQAGDEDAIETLVRTYQRGVFQLALTVLDQTGQDLLGGPLALGESAEVMQQADRAARETFVAALDRIGRYREENDFITWLYAIAIKVSLRRARRWRARRWWSQLYHSSLGQLMDPLLLRLKGGTFYDKAAPAAPAQAQEVHFLPGDLEMWNAVRGLNEKLRLPVVLRYYHDFSMEEIAGLLHISEGAVHARLDLAREKIAKTLENKENSG